MLIKNNRQYFWLCYFNSFKWSQFSFGQRFNERLNFFLKKNWWCAFCLKLVIKAMKCIFLLFELICGPALLLQALELKEL